MVNPVATTGRWRDLNADVPAPALAEALLEMGVPRRAGERRFLAWEYYDVADDPEAIRPGVSGMAQARVALLMAHAEADSGDPRFSAAAVGALAALTVDVDAGGARSMVAVAAAGQAPMMWFVERAYPGENPWKGAALNGFMVTILNLRGAAALLERSPGPGTDGPAAAALARDLADHGRADARAAPARPRLRRLELLRPAHPGPALAHLPRRPQLPLLPRAPAGAARRALPRPRVRRDLRPLAGLRRPGRRDLPGALASGARSATRSGAIRRRPAAWGSSPR